MALRPTWKSKEKRSKKQYFEEDASDQIRHMRKNTTKKRRIRYDGLEYGGYDEDGWED